MMYMVCLVVLVEVDLVDANLLEINDSRRRFRDISGALTHYGRCYKCYERGSLKLALVVLKYLACDVVLLLPLLSP